MSIPDLDSAVRRLKRNRPSGVEGLLRSIHRDPDLRDWVTIESVALAAVPSRSGSRTHLTALLANGRPGTEAIGRPWGKVVWDWASGAIVDRSDWRADPPPGLPSTPDSWYLSIRNEPLAQVAIALDRLGHDSGPREWATLTDLYEAALPQEAFGWYRALVDGAESWLDTGLPQPRNSPSTIGRRLRSLAEQVEADDLVDEIDGIVKSRSDERFVVVFAGEFNRGKSTVLNLMLERDVVPTGATPVTKVPLLVRGGEVEGIDVRLPGRRSLRRQIGEWDGLTFEHDEAEREEAGEAEESGEPDTSVIVTVDDDRLVRAELELVDLPGLNDRPEGRSLGVMRHIARADAVVLAVSAISPFGLTEREVLEHQVIGRGTNRVVVIITHVDLVERSEQGAVCDDIEQRVHRVHPGIVVVRSEPDDSGGVRRLLWSLVDGFVASPARRAWRDTTAYHRFADVADTLRIRSGEVAHLVSLQDEERAAVVAEHQESVAAGETCWAAELAGFDDVRRRRSAALAARLDALVAELAPALEIELGRVPDPYTWLNEVAPVRIRREFASFSQALTADVASAIAADFDQLATRLAEHGVHVDRPESAARPTLPALDWERRFEQSDDELTKQRRVQRIAPAVGTVLGAIAGQAIGLPVPIVWSTASSATLALVGQERIDSQLDRARAEASRLIRRGLGEMVDQFVRDADAALTAAYDSCANSMRQRWRRANVLALPDEAASAWTDRWSDVGAEAAAIRADLDAVLATPTRSESDDH